MGNKDEKLKRDGITLKKTKPQPLAELFYELGLKIND